MLAGDYRLMPKTNLKALSRQELESFIYQSGLPAFRAKQLIHWIYEKYAQSIKDITEFSKELRDKIAEKACVSNLILLDRQISTDGTQKFLFGLEDGESIESVLIPDKDRLTLCISSQVGCAMGCKFCLTGKLGLRRNLKAHEIVDQIISVRRILTNLLTTPHPCLSNPPSPPFAKAGLVGLFAGRSDLSYTKITNIVFMGMGEPLANFEEALEALLRMTGFMHISKRRITLSTAGIAPKILELSEKAPRVNLAVSLNATTDEVRNRIMPINKKYPLKVLLDSCKKYPLEPRRRITFEYVMLDGINDTRDDAIRLTKILKGIPCKINLIPFNRYEGSEFRSPSDGKILRFQQVLADGNLTALIRKSKGQDILAACGQLKGRYK